ncbi:MAG: tail fiber domain-containing protein [Bacteroidaceae bacterium]|nr:tail fiber domain-containing protein [Bacteroidaceae bacterium]
MKKTFLSMLLAASCFGIANAQLMVDEEGKVAVGIETDESINSNLAVNGRGEIGVAVHVNTQDLIGMKIERTGYNTSTPHYGMYVTNEPFGVESYGVYGRSVKSNLGIDNRIYGVAGVAGGATSGFNFGVAGFLSDSYGAGIFGSSVSSLGNIGMPEAFAGFFHGNVCVTGTLNVSSVMTLSDYRLKSNIKSISGSCLDKVLDMNVVEFKYKQREFDVAEGAEASREKRAPWYDEKSAFMKNKHYGFIAQELQKIYPDLVVEGKDGFLSVNYQEIIPLLVRSIQELNAKVEQYENGDAPILKAQSRTTDATGIDAIVTTLYQNTPNPFTESTLIRCNVAEDVVKADLYIYNMNGEQITEYAVTERGETSITIDGGSLNAGMYLYALIADGQVIDTKRMILTK